MRKKKIKRNSVIKQGLKELNQEHMELPKFKLTEEENRLKETHEYRSFDERQDS